MEETIEVPTTLSEKLTEITNEGHYAKLMAALGRRIGEIMSELDETAVDTSYAVLEEAIEAGCNEAIRKRMAN